MLLFADHHLGGYEGYTYQKGDLIDANENKIYGRFTGSSDVDDPGVVECEVTRTGCKEKELKSCGRFTYERQGDSGPELDAQRQEFWNCWINASSAEWKELLMPYMEESRGGWAQRPLDLIRGTTAATTVAGRSESRAGCARPPHRRR